MTNRESRPPVDAADPPDDEVRDAVRSDSDALLGAVDKLRRLESAKRDDPMSSSPFHDRAAQIEDLARSVFGLARRQRADGDHLDAPQRQSINDEAADDATAPDEEVRT